MGLRTLLVLWLCLPWLQGCVGMDARAPSPLVLSPLADSGGDGLHPSTASRPGGLHACPVETMSCYPGCAVVGDTYACGAGLITLAGGLGAAIEAVALYEGMTLEDFCTKFEVLCAKGGKKNIDNEYVRQVKALPKGTDPCTWLRGLQKDASARDDSEEVQKIKAAQKALGCRPNANGF